MSTKERAIAAIDSLPEDSDMADILREIAFITGTDQARKEIARGEGMDASEAKAKLREWITRWPISLDTTQRLPVGLAMD